MASKATVSSTSSLAGSFVNGRFSAGGASKAVPCATTAASGGLARVSPGLGGGAAGGAGTTVTGTVVGAIVWATEARLVARIITISAKMFLIFIWLKRAQSLV